MKAVVISFTVLWWYTSSKNAVATQQLVQDIFRNDQNGNVVPTPVEFMTILSTLQLLVGLFLSLPMYFILQKQTEKQNNEEHGDEKKKMLSPSKRIGLLHFLGCISTNLGFYFGSASVVQVVKLLEPIETLLLTVIVTKSLISVTTRKTLSILMTIIGTAILLQQKKSSESMNTKSVLFALCSGLCMASRNVFSKQYQGNRTMKCQNEKKTGWCRAALTGIENFIQITKYASFFGIIVTSITILTRRDIAPIILAITSGWIGFQSIIFHGLYNIASISVLSMISAQSHSLLNVGKRIFNILVATIVFQEGIGKQGVFGLVIASVGGITYSLQKKLSQNVIMLRRKTSIGLIGLFLMVILNMITSSNMIQNLQGEVAKPEFSWDKASSASLYLVWMFPFPPPQKAKKSSSNNLLICAYSHACKDYGDHLKINLKALTMNTYFSNYVSDHAYHKVRHMKDFPFHIHAITMISLLQTNPSTCVQTLGGNKKFCDSASFEKYDPYESVNLASTNYPYVILEKDGLVAGRNTLSPDMDQEEFAMWGCEDVPDGNKWMHQYNSGEDVQSYASATWQPFLSQIRPKLLAIKSYSGYYIGNALTPGVLETTEKDLKNMPKITLTSIFFSNFDIIKKMGPYLKNYTEAVAPFGSRSTETNKLLRSIKIKSYFSACLTLTTNMKGATLGINGHVGIDVHDRKRHVLSYDILKPNVTMEPTVKEKELILMVDVADISVVPKQVLDKAHGAQADLARWYPNKEKKMPRYEYSYKLLSLYANQAKVIITSRIHVGLPAAALGVPVIFVTSSAGKLPGGKESTGRVSGLLDIFHRVDKSQGKNWTFGNLLGTMPSNPGNHIADRYRASFWNRLKKTHFYEDTANLFGMIPLQRLGQVNIDESIQNKFHFVLNKSDLCWQLKRAIEHVFYFHPNAKVYVHSNDIIPSDLDIFVESGYDLIVQKYNIMQLKREAFEEVMPVKSVLDNDLSVYVILLWKYGGVYVSKNTMILKKIPLTLRTGVAMEEYSGTPAMIHLKKHSSDTSAFLMETFQRRDMKETWNMHVMSMDETQKCIEDEEWTLESFDQMKSNAVSLHPSIFASTSSIKFGSMCFKVVEELCIFCDEVHWDFITDNAPQKSTSGLDLSNTVQTQPSHGAPPKSTSGLDLSNTVQIQPSHGTHMNRYPEQYAYLKELLFQNQPENDTRIISFGCATGEEPLTLAQQYFDDPSIKVFGVDVADYAISESIKKASQVPDGKITILDGRKVSPKIYGPFDVVLANSVFCIYGKVGVPFENITYVMDTFPFSLFESMLNDIDSYLKVGGVLTVFNSNYNFMDSNLANRYEPITSKKCPNHFVPRIDQENKRFVDVNHQLVDCLFRKVVDKVGASGPP